MLCSEWYDASVIFTLYFNLRIVWRSLDHSCTHTDTVLHVMHYEVIPCPLDKVAIIAMSLQTSTRLIQSPVYTLYICTQLVHGMAGYELYSISISCYIVHTC